jgi:hypothetical protein
MILFPFTLFKRGLDFFAEEEALREEWARIAPADFIDTPSLEAIFFCTDLKPGCFAIR